MDNQNQTPTKSDIDKAVTDGQKELKNSVDNLTREGEALALAGWNKIRKYVYLGWLLITLAGLTAATIEFFMLRNAGKEADKYRKEMADLKKKTEKIDVQIVSNLVVREKLINIEVTNYIILTNLGAQYEKSVSAYAKFGTNGRDALRYYNSNNDKK